MTTISFSRRGSLYECVAYYQRDIDRVAAEVRRAFAPDWLLDEEYRLTANRAQGFADTWYSGPVPDAVQSWADAAGLTPAEAAASILSTRDRYNEVLEQVRRIRLVAKSKMADAADARSVKSIFEGAKAQLDAIRPPE